MSPWPLLEKFGAAFQLHEGIFVLHEPERAHSGPQMYAGFVMSVELLSSKQVNIFAFFFCIITSLLCIMIMPAVLESFTAT